MERFFAKLGTLSFAAALVSAALIYGGTNSLFAQQLPAPQQPSPLDLAIEIDSIVNGWAKLLTAQGRQIEALQKQAAEVEPLKADLAKAKAKLAEIEPKPAAAAEPEKPKTP